MVSCSFNQQLGVEIIDHAQNKSPQFWSERETHLLVNITKDLDINRFLDTHKYCNPDLSKSPLNERKGGRLSLLICMYEQLHVNKNFSGILIFINSHVFFRRR